MAIYDIANRSNEYLIRLHAAYEAHLRNLHRDAATHATKLLDKCDLPEMACKDKDYKILLCFELIRQLAHQTCKDFVGTEQLLQLVKEEVEELWSDELSQQAGHCRMTDMKAFRESKDKQLDLLDHERFVLFSAQAGIGLVPADMPGLEAG